VAYEQIISQLAQKELDAYAQAGSIAHEVISSIKTVAAYGKQSKEVNR